MHHRPALPRPTAAYLMVERANLPYPRPFSEQRRYRRGNHHPMFFNHYCPSVEFLYSGISPCFFCGRKSRLVASVSSASAR